MRDVITGLASQVPAHHPDFVPFFATGAIPYVFPLMYRLWDNNERDLLDGSIFNMFPGLSWGGRIGNLNSQQFFIQRAVPILKQLHVKTTPVRVLSIDTTNTGNAVNKIIKAIRAACTKAKVPAELHVIGVVNGSAITVLDERKVSVMRPDKKVVYLFRPNGYDLPEVVNSHDVIQLSSNEDDRLLVRVSYWVLDNVFTEDVAQLVGAAAIPRELGISNIANSGRIRIQFNNRLSSVISGRDSVGKQLAHLVARSPEARSWQLLERMNAVRNDDAGSRDQFDHLRDEVLKGFEIGEDPDALEDILNKDEVLTAAEIYALLQEEQFDPETVAKVESALATRPGDDLTAEPGSLFLRAAKARQRDCCHECGHAVARFLNGDGLLSVSVAVSDTDQYAAGTPQERGAVVYRSKQHECKCGAYVRNGSAENDSQFNLGRDCPQCEEWVINHVAALYAGGAATSLLMPESHRDLDSEFDNQAVKELLQGYAQTADKREMIENEAARRAKQIVMDERSTILALRDALVSNHGFLDGDDAAELIQNWRLTQAGGAVSA